MAEIIFYDFVSSYSVERLINKMNEFSSEEDLTIRINSGGGSVFAGQSFLAEMAKRKGKTCLAIEGNASSMAFNWALFADEVSILSTTKSLVHRATASWWGDDSKLDPQDYANLENINSEMYNAAKKRLNPDKFKEVTGKSLEDVFDMKKRQSENAVWLNSEKLVSIGLVKPENVLEITPKIAAEIAKSEAISIYFEPESKVEETVVEEPIENVNNNNFNNTTMSEQEIQAKIDAEVQTAIKAERTRISNWMVFADVDKEAVVASIESGETLSATKMQEFVAKIAEGKQLANIQGSSQGAVETPSAEQKELTEYEQEEKALNEALSTKQ